MRKSTAKIIGAVDKAMKAVMKEIDFVGMLPGSDSDPVSVGNTVIALAACMEMYDASKEYMIDLDEDFERLHKENHELEERCKNLEFQNQQILDKLSELVKNQNKEAKES